MRVTGTSEEKVLKKKGRRKKRVIQLRLRSLPFGQTKNARFSLRSTQNIASSFFEKTASFEYSHILARASLLPPSNFIPLIIKLLSVEKNINLPSFLFHCRRGRAPYRMNDMKNYRIPKLFWCSTVIVASDG